MRFGNGSTTAKENALTREFKSSFEALVLKYESPDDHDPATKALTKIGEVKNIMHDNIALSLQNTTSMETMSQSTGLYRLDCGPYNLFNSFCSQRNLRRKQVYSRSQRFRCLKICGGKDSG